MDGASAVVRRPGIPRGSLHRDPSRRYPSRPDVVGVPCRRTVSSPHRDRCPLACCRARYGPAGMVTVGDGWASPAIPVKWRNRSGEGFDPAPASCRLPMMTIGREPCAITPHQVLLGEARALLISRMRLRSISATSSALTLRMRPPWANFSKSALTLSRVTFEGSA